MTITREQLRAGRLLVGWSQFDIAVRMRVSEGTISYFETGKRQSPKLDLGRARATLEAAGVEFIAENGGGAGVRLRKAKPDPVAAEDLNASNDG
jgi:transcriptional regulator with XRE-family HTH domain